MRICFLCTLYVLYAWLRGNPILESFLRTKKAQSFQFLCKEQILQYSLSVLTALQAARNSQGMGAEERFL